MVKLLGIDASTECCSAALLLGDKVYQKLQIAPQGHTKLLLPMVDELLQEHNLALNDLDAIACGKGPGSFTGVRIGVSMAQGLAFGADKKLIGIGDLEALAYKAMTDTNLNKAIAIIDARMGEVYLGIYEKSADKLKALIEECVVKPNEAHDIIAKTIKDESFAICGTGIVTYSEITFGLANLIRAPQDLPQASSIVLLAKDSGEALDPELVLPQYVRDTVTWKKVGEQ